MLASDDGARIERRDQSYRSDDAEMAAFNLARQLLDTVQSPVGSLAGKRVLVTRGVPADPLITLLRVHGAAPLVLPTIQIKPTTNAAAVDTAIARLNTGDYDWLVFTSGNAVSVMLEALQKGPNRPGLRIAAVGPATAALLTQAGFTPDLVANPATGEALVAALVARGMAGQRVLLPLSNLARDTVPDGLRRAGAVVDVVEAYRTEPVAISDLDSDLLACVRRGEVDAVIFLSPSSVYGLARLLDGDFNALRTTTVACIGPTTAAAATDVGLTVSVVPGESTVEALVAALAENRQDDANEERAVEQAAGVREMAER
jgi:uroporphyrinogen III methyltransferase/synthase